MISHLSQPHPNFGSIVLFASIHYQAPYRNLSATLIRPVKMPARSSSSSVGRELPNRRRAWQACTTCRARKTRCDAAKPKCSLCVAQNVECVYKDSQQPRIDPTARMLLDRIQMLEDRIFSSQVLSGQGVVDRTEQLPEIQKASCDTSMSNSSPEYGKSMPGAAKPSSLGSQPSPDTLDEAAPDLQIPVSLHHTANSNHVLTWPIVQQILADSSLGELPNNMRPDSATDIFFAPAPSNTASDPMPSDSWRLFQDGSLPVLAESHQEYLACINAYFDEVDVFFPLISFTEIIHLLETVAACERPSGDIHCAVSPAQYCLLLLVLCIGSFVRYGHIRIRLDDTDEPIFQTETDVEWRGKDIEKGLWEKAKLLLGHISPTMTTEAAQCSMLARYETPTLPCRHTHCVPRMTADVLTSLYMGANGRIPDSLHWAHATSVKCATLVKRRVTLFTLCLTLTSLLEGLCSVPRTPMSSLRSFVGFTG